MKCAFSEVRQQWIRNHGAYREIGAFDTTGENQERGREEKEEEDESWKEKERDGRTEKNETLWTN